MKRVISLMLTALLVFGSLSVVSFAADEPYKSGSCGTALLWSVDKEHGTLSLTGDGVMPDFSSTDSAPWAGVDFSAVEISDGVKSVGENAFANSAVESVSFGLSVELIGGRAFEGCNNLQKVFIPSGVTAVGDLAFYNCTSLKYCYISAGVTSFGDRSFGYCLDAMFGDGYIKIDGFKIRGETGSEAEKYASDNGFTFVDIRNCDDCFNYTLVGEKVLITGITDSLIKFIDIPATIDGYSVFGIDDYAFKGSAAETVNIPDSVTYISSIAFTDVKALCELNVAEGNLAFAAKDGILYNKSLTELYCFPANKTTPGAFPLTLFSIGDCAFVNTSINGLKLPETVTSIGNNAFKNSSIKSITMPETLLTLGEGVFSGCDKLSSVNIPDSLTEIPASAFSGCKSLTQLTIPDTVAKIGANAYYDIPELKAVMLLGASTEIGEHAFGYYKTDENEYEKVSEFTVCGSTESTASAYADLNGFLFADSAVGTPVLSELEADNGYITVNWNKVDNAEGYRILRKTADSEYEVIAVIENNTEDFYCDLDVESGNIYTYTVEAYRGAFNSDRDEVGLSIEYIVIDEPLLISATFVSGCIDVKWKATENAEGYELYRSTDSDVSWKKIAELPAGTVRYKDKSAVSGQTNYYTVKAYNGERVSTYDTDGVSAFYLANPVLKKAANSTKGITVSWTKTAGATGYIIGRKTGKGNWVKLTETGDVSSYTDKSVKAYTKYTYTVVPVKGSVKGFYDENGVSCTYIITPTLVSAVNGTKGVTVKWKTVSGVYSYVVYRKTAGSNWSRIAIVKGDKSSSYLDKTVKSGTQYFYTVRAYKSSVYSAYNTNGLKTVFLKTPALKSATSKRAGITVTWSKVSGATGYIVYRKLPGGSWSKIATGKTATASSYTDKKAKKGTTYTYTVRAYNGSYKSSYYSGVTCKDKY